MVDVVDEARLAGLALTATAAQLAKMISGFRSADGMRIPQQNKRSVTWHEREDGMIEVRARLPKEEAAVLHRSDGCCEGPVRAATAETGSGGRLL